MTTELSRLTSQLARVRAQRQALEGDRASLVRRFEKSGKSLTWLEIPTGSMVVLGVVVGAGLFAVLFGLFA